MVNFAYLDNSATTQPDERVISAMEKCMREGYFNPSSVYAPAVDAFREERACREELLRYVRAVDCDVIFTSGGTEANNLAILGASAFIRGMSVAAVTSVEHPSVLAAYDELKANGVDVRIIPVNRRGELNYEELEKALNDGAKIVSAMQVNNETGAINDIVRLREMTRGRALLHVDGVQGFLRVPFDMKYCDMYSLSAHKLHGPKGIGALIVKSGVRLKPRNIGGGQESGLRSGTENTPGIAGLREAAKLISECDISALMDMKMYMIEKFLDAAPGASLNGPDPKNAAPHIANISFPNVRGEVMLHALEAERIYTSTGSACSSKKVKVSKVLTAMGISQVIAEQALRFSISPKTTREEIDYAAEKIKTIYAQLKRFQRR